MCYITEFFGKIYFKFTTSNTVNKGTCAKWQALKIKICCKVVSFGKRRFSPLFRKHKYLSRADCTLTILSTIMIFGPSCLWIAKICISLSVNTIKSMASIVRPAWKVDFSILQNTWNESDLSKYYWCWPHHREQTHTCRLPQLWRGRWSPYHIYSSYPPHTVYIF